MTLDLGKRLMDCTLGEYIAAERTIGIISGWAIALFTVIIAATGRYFYNRWKKSKPEDSTPEDLLRGRKLNSGQHVCNDYSPRGGYVCTLVAHGARSYHVAHNEEGQIVCTWP